jgi:hypothetical protein
MQVNIEGSTIDLNSRGLCSMALAYLNRKIELIYEKGEDSRAKPFLELLPQVEAEYNKFKR